MSFVGKLKEPMIINLRKISQAQKTNCQVRMLKYIYLSMYGDGTGQPIESY
jgi:hypothetical protein